MRTVRSYSTILAGVLVITSTLAWSQADPLKHTAPLNINTHFIRIHDDATAGAGYDSPSITHSYPVRGATGIYIDFQLIGGYLLESGNRRLWARRVRPATETRRATEHMFVELQSDC